MCGDFVRKDLGPLVKNKSVAIVGAATSILGTRQGDAIDAHDVVIRINLRRPGENERIDVGSTTDLLYAGMILFPHIRAKLSPDVINLEPFDFEEWKKTGLVYGIRTLYKSQALITQRLIPYWHPLKPESPYNTSTPPHFHTTGAVCACDCVLNGATTVSLYGFDCFHTPDRYRLASDAETSSMAMIQHVETKRIKILIEDGDYPFVPDMVLLATIQQFRM